MTKRYTVVNVDIEGELNYIYKTNEYGNAYDIMKNDFIKFLETQQVHIEIINEEVRVELLEVYSTEIHENSAHIVFIDDTRLSWYIIDGDSYE